MAEGYKLQFITIPIQNEFTPRKMSESKLKICQQKVKSFKSENALISVSPSDCAYISDIFPVPKKTEGEFRIIFDLTELNKHIRKVHFRMDNLSYIIALISPNDYLVSIDLSDAYHSIAMHLQFMPYLAFILAEICYQFTCLPQGLSPAPRIFTMLMKVVLKYLRTLSVKIAAWIDDFILAARSASLVSSHAALTLRTFEELGFVPNLEKSHLIPVQRLCHLGLIWDTVEFNISIPQDKLKDIQSKCRKALSSKVTIRFLSSILGSIEWFRWGFPYAAIHYRGIQRCVNSYLSKGFSYNTKIPKTKSAISDLEWWAAPRNSLPAKTLFSFSPDVTVYTDSSKTGWGGWSTDGAETYGFWSLSEKDLHINILELQTVEIIFQCFFKIFSNCSILIRTDNTSVVAYINKQGGSCSAKMCALALKIWSFCISRKIMINALYISSDKNKKADALSRKPFNDHSYFLPQEIYDKIQENLPFFITKDYFASRLNFKLPIFYSLNRDPFASKVNAFSEKWSSNAYLFPPLPLINRTISKFVSDNIKTGLIITPFWASKPWFSTLLNLLIAQPFLLPSGFIQDPEKVLPLKKCHFLAWPIGCNQALHMGFLEKLPKHNLKALIKRPCAVINEIGEGSGIGVIKNKFITVRLP